MDDDADLARQFRNACALKHHVHCPSAATSAVGRTKAKLLDPLTSSRSSVTLPVEPKVVVRRLKWKRNRKEEKEEEQQQGTKKKKTKKRKKEKNKKAANNNKKKKKKENKMRPRDSPRSRTHISLPPKLAHSDRLASASASASTWPAPGKATKAVTEQPRAKPGAHPAAERTATRAVARKAEVSLGHPQEVSTGEDERERYARSLRMHQPIAPEILNEEVVGDAIEANLIASEQFSIRQIVEERKDEALLHNCYRYIVFNALGDYFMEARENVHFFRRHIEGASRSFDITFQDRKDRPVLNIQRGHQCCAGCCLLTCCSRTCTIFYPIGETLGFVKQDFLTCNWWTVTNPNEEVVFFIEGPWCMPSQCWVDIKFSVLNKRMEHLGNIVKKFDVENVGENIIDIFGARFELSLTLSQKVLLLGATFLIDFALFNNNDVKRRNERIRIY